MEPSPSEMEPGPPKVIEFVVGLLIPRSCREHVLGDLCERYESPAQYIVDAARTVPFVIASQVRRKLNVLLRGGKMPAEDMNRRSENFRKKVLRGSLGTLLTVIFVGFLGWQAIIKESISDRIAGASMIAAASYVAYRLYRKLSVSPDTYKAQLERERDALRTIWSWFLGPVLGALVIFAVRFPLANLDKPSLWTNILPFLILVLLWSVLVARFTNREARRLQKEIDAL